MPSPCRLLDFCEKPPLPKDIKTSLIPDDISCEILSFVSSVKVFCSTQPCWGWACWQPDTTLTAKKEGETCKQRFALWQGGAIANSHASFASNSSFCRFSSISSSYDSLRKLSCSILASFFSFLIMLFNFLKTLLTAEVSFMVMCSRCECQRQTVSGRATQPFILPPVEEEEEEEEEGWGVVGVRAVGRCNWSPKIMGQFGWRVIQGGMLVLNIRHHQHHRSHPASPPTIIRHGS